MASTQARMAGPSARPRAAGAPTGGGASRFVRRGPGAHRVAPVGPGRRRDAGDHGVAHAVEQVVLVPDVAVQRHRVDAERLAQPTHAQPVEAVAVGRVDRGPHDAVAGQRALRGAGSGLPTATGSLSNFGA